MQHKLRPIKLMEQYSKLREADLIDFISRFHKNEGHAHRNCPVCSLGQASKSFEKEGFDFVTCDDCGCLYVNPVPTDDLLTMYYDGFSSMEFFHENILKPTEDERKKIFHRRAQDMKPFVKTGDKILEIGSSIGFFIEAALKEGWDVSGVEINSNLVEYTKNKFNVPIYQGMFEHVSFDHCYDMVVMWEVLEHIVEPYGLLKKIAQALPQGGRFVGTLPNIDGIEFKVCGKDHEMIEAPGHLNYFSIRTLEKLFDRAGFKLIFHSTPGILDFINIMNDIHKRDSGSIGDSFLTQLQGSIPKEDWDEVDATLTRVIQKNKLSGNIFIVAEKL